MIQGVFKRGFGRFRPRRAFLGVICLFLPVGLWCVFTPRPPLLEGVSFSTAVLDRNGGLMRLGLAADERYRLYTPLAEIAPEMVEATLLYEDRHFYRHPGVNVPALARAAIMTYVRGGRRMGASTITMQLARLRLNLDTGHLWGKLRQMERALAYELHYSKKDILEAYLNLAPYGGNIEGCGAASLIYYRKQPSRLNLPEAVSLAVTPQNPSSRGPQAVESDALESARKRLFGLWMERHPEDEGSARLSRGRLEVFSPADLPFIAPHVSAEAVLNRPGPETARTTLDLRLQKLLEGRVQAVVERHARLGVNNACALLLHWPSMEIRALVGSADFFNAEIEGQVDGTKARRSPGSVLKPFIYALALDQGLIHPKTLLYDSPRSFGGYDPENADQTFRGPLSATEALRSSRNIPAISLAGRLGKEEAGQEGERPDLYAFLRRAGVRFDHGREHYGLALVLGGAEINMRETASLYALLANRGIAREPVLFRDGRGMPDGPRLLSAEACALALNMLRNLPAARGTPGDYGRRVPLYGKTGTSNGLRDAWTAGVFGPYVLVVWVGNFDNRPNPVFMGGRVAAPLFLDIAEAVSNMEQLEDLPGRGLADLNLVRVRVCSETGDLNTSLCPHREETWFIPGVSPIEDSGVFRQILVDRESGLRACVETPGKTERRTWEFWPTDLRQVFRQAGIVKPAPPPFSPECGAADNTGGLPPEILSPKPGVVYHRSLSRPQDTVLTLHASGDADVTDFFWFSEGVFIGRSRPDEHLVWVPPGGVSSVRVVDNFGRSGQRTVVVELTE